MPMLISLTKKELFVDLGIDAADSDASTHHDIIHCHHFASTKGKYEQ